MEDVAHVSLLITKRAEWHISATSGCNENIVRHLLEAQQWICDLM